MKLLHFTSIDGEKHTISMGRYSVDEYLILTTDEPEEPDYAEYLYPEFRLSSISEVEEGNGAVLPEDYTLIPIH